MLIEETTKHHLGTEKEASEFIETIKSGQKDGGYTVFKAGYTRKEVKAKGEVIDEYFIVAITKKFNGE